MTVLPSFDIVSCSLKDKYPERAFKYCHHSSNLIELYLWVWLLSQMTSHFPCWIPPVELTSLSSSESYSILSKSSRQSSNLGPQTPSLEHSRISHLLRFWLPLVRTRQTSGMKDTIRLDGFKKEHLSDFIGFGIGI